jgi:outer membrane autotransporter protein
VPALGVLAVNGKYRTEGWSGRLEGALAMAKVGSVTISPIAALQAQSIRTPGFTETNNATGAAFGVTSLGRTNNTARSELGVKLDVNTVIGGSQVTVYAKAAWAHYLARDSAFTAGLVGLAGSTFTVHGAKPARDAALLSLGANMRLTPQMTIGANFNSELSQSTQGYSGSVKLNYAF